MIVRLRVCRLWRVRVANSVAVRIWRAAFWAVGCAAVARGLSVLGSTASAAASLQIQVLEDGIVLQRHVAACFHVVAYLRQVAVRAWT